MLQPVDGGVLRADRLGDESHVDVKARGEAIGLEQLLEAPTWRKGEGKGEGKG